MERNCWKKNWRGLLALNGKGEMMTEAQRNFIFAWSMPLMASCAFCAIYLWADPLAIVLAGLLLGITLDTALEGICLLGFLNGAPLEFPLRNPTQKPESKTFPLSIRWEGD